MKRSLHDKILYFITYLAIVLFAFSACLLDSENYILFLIIVAASITWLSLFAYANREKIERLYK